MDYDSYPDRNSPDDRYSPDLDETTGDRRRRLRDACNDDRTHRCGCRYCSPDDYWPDEEAPLLEPGAERTIVRHPDSRVVHVATAGTGRVYLDGDYPFTL
jgi:hypothetical protein